MFDSDGITTIKGLTDAVVQRQQILSNNLANIETKGYVRQDLDFSRILTDLKSKAPGIESSNESLLARSRYKDFSKPMSLESELSKLYDNHLRYLLLVKSVNHHYEHMKKALEVRAN
jgi:flagellar basal body rod protein FlgB